MREQEGRDESRRALARRQEGLVARAHAQEISVVACSEVDVLCPVPAVQEDQGYLRNLEEAGSELGEIVAVH